MYNFGLTTGQKVLLQEFCVFVTQCIYDRNDELWKMAHIKNAHSDTFLQIPAPGCLSGVFFLIVFFQMSPLVIITNQCGNVHKDTARSDHVRSLSRYYLSASGRYRGWWGHAGRAETPPVSGEIWEYWDRLVVIINISKNSKI